MYNLDVYEILNNSEKYKEVYSWYYQNAFIPLFTNYLSFILQAPLPLLLASLAGKVVIFFLVYKKLISLLISPTNPSTIPVINVPNITARLAKTTAKPATARNIPPLIFYTYFFFQTE